MSTNEKRLAEIKARADLCAEVSASFVEDTMAELSGLHAEVVRLRTALTGARHVLTNARNGARDRHPFDVDDFDRALELVGKP